MNKHGIVEVQFNWIFILIVGVVILIFFVGLARWYQDNEERQTASELMTKLQTIMVGAQISDSTASRIDVPRMELRFLCDPDECDDEGCASTFNFAGTDVERGTDLDIIFAPNSIESDFIYAWSLEWSTPYKTSNFLYMTSPAVKYILVYDETKPESKKLARQVFSRMSDNKFIYVKLIDVSEIGTIEYNHEYLVRVVMFFEPTNIMAMSTSMTQGEWDVIYVYGDADKGTVKFPKEVELNGVTHYEPDDGKEYPFIGIPSLIGAIYSEDYEHYKCNMKKAFIRQRSVNQVYKLRTEELFLRFKTDNRCHFYYDVAVRSSFDEISTELSDLDFPDMNKFLIDFMESQKAIKNADSGTIIKTCPRIY